MEWLVPGWVVALVAVAVIALVTGVADRLLRAAEDRGWVYYRRRRASRTAVGNAMMSILEIYAPEQHHTVEERRRYDADEAVDDDPFAPR